MHSLATFAVHAFIEGQASVLHVTMMVVDVGVNCQVLVLMLLVASRL